MERYGSGIEHYAGTLRMELVAIKEKNEGGRIEVYRVDANGKRRFAGWTKESETRMVNKNGELGWQEIHGYHVSVSTVQEEDEGSWVMVAHKLDTEGKPLIELNTAGEVTFSREELLEAIKNPTKLFP